MRRWLIWPLVGIVAAVAALTPVGTSAASSQDACKDGGFLNLVGLDGSSFKNQGQCVSYAVQGGTLLRELDAASVYTPLSGAGGPVSPPDANGDGIGSTIDGGVITGAFSAQPVGFGMLFLGDVLHYPTGIAHGTGTALCDPCLVGGVTGTVSFTTTVVGHAVVFNGMTFVAYDGGTWQITGGTGALASISGSGTWTQEADGTRVFAGTIVSPV